MIRRGEERVMRVCAPETGAKRWSGFGDEWRPHDMMVKWFP